MKLLTILFLLLSIVFVPSNSISKGIAAGGNEPWSRTRVSDYQAMKSAGATRIRIDIPWDLVQPTEKSFDWSRIDPVVKDVNNAGLKFLAILHMTPGWANNDGGNYAPPTDLSLTQNYCYQTVKRYIPRGIVEYEIGNEINSDHPGWITTGGYYVDNLLNPCSAGIKQATRELNRSVTILLGALTPWDDPVPYLQEVYAHGAANKFNVISYHPYTTDPLTNANMNSIADDLNQVTITATGKSRKIWATEYGAPTGGDASVTESRQAELVSEAFIAWYRHSYAGPLLWYSHRDIGTSADREDHFGLLRFDGSQKPAYSAYKGI